eukprot:m.132675 g.132675  ORF g.132675 m.132675 type:complete len:140 (+) comp13940_c0_seq3:1376-1795(+)
MQGVTAFFRENRIYYRYCCACTHIILLLKRAPHHSKFVLQLSSLITAALLSITSDSDAATSGGYDSWITADSYQFTQTAQELFNIITFDHIAQKKKCFRPTKMNAQRRLASASASMGTFVSRAFVSLHGVWVCTWPFLA